MYNKLSIENLEVTYIVKKNRVTAVDNITCDFDNGINVIIGESGSGKTTLLRAIAHSLEYNGDIKLDDKNILEFKKKDIGISYLSQNFILYPHLTIFENIAFPLKNLKYSEEEIYSRVYDLANLFDLMPCLSRLPKHLSIGQQQRVAFARALVKIPSILLLDEPFSNADKENKNEFAILLKKIIKKRKILTICVTHDLESFLRIGDSFFEMNEGKINGPFSNEEISAKYQIYLK